jgi:hypothetical protein
MANTNDYGEALRQIKEYRSTLVGGFMYEEQPS